MDGIGPSFQRQPHIADEIFAGGGEMGARMRAFDWARTPLGPVAQWPQSLRTSVSICLNSRFPVLVWWGPRLVKLYNDAYVLLIGQKHPWALGSAGRDVWPEIWDTIGPMLNGVMERGEATWADDLLLLLERNGYPEECYFTFSYSPIRDESGGVGGVFTPVTETTERVIGERRLRTLRDLATNRSSTSRNPIQTCRAAVETLAANPYDLPFAAIYLFDQDREIATLASATISSGLPANFVLSREPWLTDQCLTRGEACTLDLRSDHFVPLPCSAWGVPPEQAIAVPIVSSGTGEPQGFLFAGISPRKRLDDEYRLFYSLLAGQIASAIREADAMGRETLLRAQAEAERTKIRDLFLQAPAAIAVTSGPEHRFTLLNERYVRLLGRQSTEGLIGKPCIEALPELEGQGFIELLDRVYRTGVPFVGNEMPARLDRASSGQEVEAFFNFVYQPAFSAAGEVEGILVLAVEVTEQVRARREIETREEQFRVLADSIPQLAWMANADGGIFWYNQRWYEYTGATPEQMLDWGWQSVHDPKLLPLVLERYKHSIATGEPFQMTFPLRHAKGEFRTFLTLALPVRDATGKVVRWFGTNTDVNDQRKTEEALRQSEKLAVVGRLASSIAHEINNPLEAVMNLVFLAQESAVCEETKTYLEYAGEELGRVAQITNQTLRFHRQQSSPTSTDVVELLHSILALYRGKLARPVELRLETRETPQVICYEGEVRQLLANLIGNALDAMPKGGTLCLRVRPGTDWRTREEGVRVTVADTGHGMSAETKRHIYEPFFTTKGAIGTGLGLWVTAGIVEKHQGSIHVRSRVQPGSSGTVFTLSLPYAGAARSVEEEQSHVRLSS